MIRPAAVAGQFYPEARPEVEADLAAWSAAPVPRRHAIGVMVPHAGWMYSGATAARVYAAVQIPDRVILVGPNHHGLGSDFALYDAGAWQTPLGDVPVAEPLAAELMDRCEWISEDPAAHRREHSLEVQVPMLRWANPRVQIVPLIVGGTWPESGGRDRLRQIGRAIAAAVSGYGQPVLLVASSDLTHYEDRETARSRDRLVLDALASLDEEALMDRVIENRITMCGVASAYIVLVAAKKLGARRVEVVDYCTSGDVTGDHSAVVGYGGVIIE